jgi:SAM-dependent methyltransferase
MRYQSMDTNVGAARPVLLKRWWQQPPNRRRTRATGEVSSLPTADRKLLQGVILPFYLSSPDVQTALCIGPAQVSEAMRRITAKGVDRLGTDVSELPVEEVYDLIVVDQVFGSDVDEGEELLTACYHWLRPNGHLLLGWADVADVVPVDSLQTLNCFVPFVFPPLHTARQITDTFTRYTFQFFRKPTSLDG